MGWRDQSGVWGLGNGVCGKGRVALVLIVLMMWGRAMGAAVELPSPGEIEKKCEDGKYREALQDLTRVLALTGPPAAGYDKFAMLMLKGECMVQLKQATPAVVAVFDQARKEAFAEGKPERAVSAVAMGFLVQHSGAGQYVPKAAGDHKPIPWLDRSRRAEAYGALLADELPGAERKMPALARVTAMAPLMEFAKTVGGLHALELASGKDASSEGESATRPLVDGVAGRAAELINGALTDPSAKVLKISDQANELVQVNVPQHDPNTGRAWVNQKMQRRGLDGEQTAYLKNVGENCGKMMAAAKELSQLLLTENEALKGAAANAGALRMRAADLLTDDYTNTTDRSERNLTQPK